MFKYLKNRFNTAYLPIIALVLMCMSDLSAQQNTQSDFYPNGNRKRTTIHAQEFEYITEWYEDGTKLLEGALRYDKRVGSWGFFYENGKPQYTMFYDSIATDQIKESTLGIIVRIKSFDENGKVLRVENFSEGLPFVNSEYYPNGQLRELVNYDKGEPVSGMNWYSNGGVKQMFVFKKDYTTNMVESKETVRMKCERVIYKKWFESGRVELDGLVDMKGVKVGTWNEYDKFGNRVNSIDY
jgi:antitoxin component YwqK of YwqJK toxin-antitoxin module